MTGLIENPALRAFVERYRHGLAWLLSGLVFSALALDYFASELLGPRLLWLRLIYMAIMLLIVVYLSVLSTTSRQQK
jgi:multisubunit Na+/H+ antiporter MnhE subunit